MYTSTEIILFVFVMLTAIFSSGFFFYHLYYGYIKMWINVLIYRLELLRGRRVKRKKDNDQNN